MQKVEVLVFISAAIFFAYLSNDLGYPFLTLVTKRRGIPLIWTGIIFSIFDIFRCLSSPLLAVMMPIIGLKESLVFGCFLEGLANILLGMVDSLSTNTSLISLACTTRIISATGNLLIQTSIISIIASNFQENMSTIYGIVTMCKGFGGILSPYIGGLLFKRGGFQLPFTVAGGTVTITAIIGAVAIKKMASETVTKKTNPGLFLKAIFIPSIMCGAICNFSVGLLLESIFSTLSYHLSVISQDKIQADEIGEIFMYGWYSYSIASPLVGYLSENKLKGDLLIIVGLSLFVIELLLIGPSSLLHLPPRKDYNLIRSCLLIQGFAAPCCVIPILSGMLDSVRKAGLSDTIEVHSVISSIFVFSKIAGKIVGSIFGSYFTMTISFEWTTTMLSFWILALTLVLSAQSIRRRCIENKCTVN